MAAGRTFGAWLSGDLLTRAEKRVAAVAGGNESKYVKGLIERDVDESGTVRPSIDLLVELARQYQPALVKQLEQALARRLLTSEASADGGVVLARFLDAYAQALQDDDFKPEQPFALVNAAQLNEWDRVSEARMKDLAMRVAEIQAGYRSDPITSARDARENQKVALADSIPRAYVMSSKTSELVEIRSEFADKKSRLPKKNRKSRDTSGQPKLTPHSTQQPA